MRTAVNTIRGAMSYILLLALSTGCEKTPKYESIEDKKLKNQLNDVMVMASSKLSKDEFSVFRLDTLTKFSWDKMYGFGGAFTREQVEKEIGIDWPYSGGEGMMSTDVLFVFMKDHEMVSTIKYPEGDNRFVHFDFYFQGKYLEVLNSNICIYKQFYKTNYSFYLLPIEEKDDIVQGKKINIMKYVSL